MQKRTEKLFDLTLKKNNDKFQDKAKLFMD